MTIILKKMITASLVALATTTGFLFSSLPVQAHPRRFYNYYRHHYYYPFYRQRISYCYPVTQWSVDEDPAYHPQAYADGYRQGRESAREGRDYTPRTAGGEFGRGFEDGYYGRKFSGQKQVVPNVVLPYTTTDCSWY